MPLRSPVARSQRLLQRQRDISRCLGVLCVLCVRKEYNVRMVIYISRGARKVRKVFIASCAIAGAVVSFATTRVRRGMENGEQTETRSSKRLSTPSPLRGTHPCPRGRKWMLGYLKHTKSPFPVVTIPLSCRGVRGESVSGFSFSAHPSVICTLSSVICTLSSVLCTLSSIVPWDYNSNLM